MDARNTRYAKLRIAQKKLGLDDDVYRDRLERKTGKRSAKEMSVAEMDRVLEQFRKDGFRTRPTAHNPQVRKVFALWTELGPSLRSGGSRESLRAFVKRMVGVDDPNFLTAPQAGVVIEALKAWEKRL
ncbi:regulatory protein GemA [Neokomagataea anthophila]|uniref:Regulatory protein GemA n=1 Tax=Neokomagataea anthophila TaxID=2826925 RepID=A0ABS5E6I7_9PROT|nr:regulatory protein GemA [Neokomagataea anthophila]MBR0559519.1 regulatory protein GemA [Neokomagataea anthophila]